MSRAVRLDYPSKMHITIMRWLHIRASAVLPITQHRSQYMPLYMMLSCPAHCNVHAPGLPCMYLGITEINIRANQSALVHGTYTPWKFAPSNAAVTVAMANNEPYQEGTAHLYTAATSLPTAAVDACGRTITSAAGLRTVISAEASSHPSGRQIRVQWAVLYNANGDANSLADTAGMTNMANLTMLVNALNADTTP